MAGQVNFENPLLLTLPLLKLFVFIYFLIGNIIYATRAT